MRNANAGRTRRRSGPGRGPGMTRRLVRWLPVLLLTGGLGFSRSGWLGAGTAQDIAQAVCVLVIGLIVGMEARDAVASRKGKLQVVSLCSCQAEVAALRDQLDEVRAEQAEQARAWDLWRESRGLPAARNGFGSRAERRISLRRVRLGLAGTRPLDLL